MGWCPQKQITIMSKIYLFLADGFETVEALAPVDVMRRAGLEVVTTSIMGRKEVTSGHGVAVVADALFEVCITLKVTFKSG